jgi:hypothetical protein
MTQYAPKHEFKHKESKSRINRQYLTCPHCGKIALPNCGRDYDMDYIMNKHYRRIHGEDGLFINVKSKLRTILGFLIEKLRMR